jgi:hypothetical protein
MVDREMWYKANYSLAFISVGRPIQWLSYLLVFLILSSDYFMSFPSRPTIELGAQLDGVHFTHKQKTGIGASVASDYGQRGSTLA